MITFLSKFFIKDRTNYSDNKVREGYASLSGFVGIVLNLIICAGKIAVGILSGAISVVADGVNNLTDAGSSVITIMGFKLANKPIDRKHPFGHGRMEYISAMLVSVIIVVVGFELLISSVEKIITPETVSISVWTLAILAFSVLVKLYMFAYNFVWAKKLNAAAMKATAYDSISDAVSTLVVLVCSIVTFFKPSVVLDSYAGILVAVFILFTGFRSFVEILGDLLGKAPEKEFVLAIEKAVMESSIISGIHDLVVHDYGPGRVMVTLHAEIPADMDIMQAHDEIDNVEQKISRRFNCHTTIHMDPVFRNDEKTETLRKTLEKIVKNIHSDITLHDFRMNEGPTHTNLIFDVVVPFETGLKDDMLRQRIERAVQDEIGEKYKIVVQIDRPFV